MMAFETIMGSLPFPGNTELQLGNVKLIPFLTLRLIKNSPSKITLDGMIRDVRLTRYQPIKKRLALNRNTRQILEGEFLMSLPYIASA